MKLNIYGLCIHGLLGDIFSSSMNGLAAALNAGTPRGVHFNVVGGNDPDFSEAEIESNLDAALARGAWPILIGHSLGADMAINQANRLAAKNISIPLIGAVDPVDWTSNTLTPGRWLISSNAEECINPYQDYYPGGGHVEIAKNNTRTHLVRMHMPQYPHASLWGYDIGSCPETQHALITAVQVVVTKMKNAT